MIYRNLILKENGLFQKKNKEFKWESGDKKYEFILIVNRNTRSAGELAYYQIKEIFKNSKVTLIGENTSGCLLFCEGCGYRITNSKIFFGLSSGIAFSQKITGFDEGKGFVPDFWVYNEEQLFDTIKHLTTAST